MSDVLELATGGGHTCARLGTTEVACVGNNYQSQLGTTGVLETFEPQTVISESGSGVLVGVSRIFAGGANTCALFANGALWCWGSNQFGELGSGASVLKSPTPQRVALTCP
jgi:alpha-tubulin suppressor-like RCC1 family protein